MGHKAKARDKVDGGRDGRRIASVSRRKRWRRAAWTRAMQGRPTEALTLQRALVTALGRSRPREEIRDLFRLLRWEAATGSWKGLLACSERVYGCLARRGILGGTAAGWLFLARAIAQFQTMAGSRSRRGLAAVLRSSRRGPSTSLFAAALDVGLAWRIAAGSRGDSGLLRRLLRNRQGRPRSQLPLVSPLPGADREMHLAACEKTLRGLLDGSGPTVRLSRWSWKELPASVSGLGRGNARREILAADSADLGVRPDAGSPPVDSMPGTRCDRGLHLLEVWLRLSEERPDRRLPAWAIPLIARTAEQTAPETTVAFRERLYLALGRLATATAEPWARASVLEARAEVSLWLAGDGCGEGARQASGAVSGARADLVLAAGLFRRLGWGRRADRCEERWLRLRWPALSPSVSKETEAAWGARLSNHRHPSWVRRTLADAGFWTRDPRVLQDLAPLLLLAACPLPVLILGESGTGKEVLARAIHRWSGLHGEFVPIHCGAIPRDLLESELFGHLRGAFTGASADKPGLVEAADGGSLFLDEIGEMGMEAQMKMLRVLESGEVRRLGDLRPRRAKVRLVAATHRDLDAAVASGAFRLDLFHRIRGIIVRLRPLRERRGDIPYLASRLLASAAAPGRPPLQLTPASVACLLSYPWPGNVREMKGVLHRAAHLARALGQEIVPPEMLGLGAPPHDLPPDAMGLVGDDGAESEEAALPPREEVARAGLDAVLEDIERRLIVDALEASGWNRTRAARALGNLSRTTLLSKMKRLGIQSAVGEVTGSP